MPASALEPELDECRLALERARLARIHPDHFLHVSLQELGFVTETPRQADEISPAALEEFVTNAAGPIGEQPRFHLTLGGVNSFQDAAFLEVHDGGHASLLHQRLLDIAATRRKSGFPYLPHMTVAHYTAAAPAAPMAEILSAWRDTRFGRTEVTEIEVATLSVSEPYPPFVPYAVFPLTG